MTEAELISALFENAGNGGVFLVVAALVWVGRKLDAVVTLLRDIRGDTKETREDMKAHRLATGKGLR